MIPRAYVQTDPAAKLKLKVEMNTQTERVWRELIARIKGEAWKMTPVVLNELRAKKYPKLLRDSV